jgi:hypothetical protein
MMAEEPKSPQTLPEDAKLAAEKKRLEDAGPVDTKVKQQDSQGNVIADENEIRKKGSVPESVTGTPAPVSAPGAPAVHTDSRVDFTKQKLAELEQAAVEAENLQGTRRLYERARLRAQIRELKERENATYSGANIRAPRGSILHAEEAIMKHPEYHYRFVNMNAPGKADNAKAIGYEKVTEEDGGKTLGDLALFRTPLEKRASRVAGQEQQTKDDIKKVTEDLRGEVREMARFMRKKGIDIDENRLGVFSESEEG